MFDFDNSESMKYKIFFLCFTLILMAFLSVNAQQTYKREIIWEDIKAIPLTEEKQLHYLYFRDAIIHDNDNYLPEFYEQFRIASENMKVHASLRNMVFEELINDKNIPIEDIDNVEQEIIIKTNIAVARKVPFACISFVPLRKNLSTGKIEKLSKKVI